MCMHINIRLRFFLSWVCMFVVLLFPLSIICLGFSLTLIGNFFPPSPPLPREEIAEISKEQREKHCDFLRKHFVGADQDVKSTCVGLPSENQRSRSGLYYYVITIFLYYYIIALLLLYYSITRQPSENQASQVGCGLHHS